MTLQVLIVDDETPIRRLLQNWVEAEGAAVLLAGTSEEALNLIADVTLAVALCDIRLPGRDGLWLAEQLRVDRPETAVVMTTGVNEFDAAVNSMQAGVVDYLVKPFTRERLTEALQRAFFAHQSRRALGTMQRELEARRAQITEALAELELNASSGLEMMLEMLRARHPESYEHAQRVSRLAVNLAMTLQIGEPRLSDIERAALLHNLGRLALPDNLLRAKEHTLSEADRARVRAYPLHGQAILRNVPYLAAASELAVAAHERYDGRGFPHGLKGEAIPLGARIIGVANAYDELVSGIGRDSITPTDAVDILCETRAAEFDPLVLGALKMLAPGSTGAA
jgi:response regulator RpfG family c-di-GMP phosphodiesterase